MAQITITLNETGERMTPRNLGGLIADALAFGTDDPAYTYEEDAYTIDLVAIVQTRPWALEHVTVGTVTLS